VNGDMGLTPRRLLPVVLERIREEPVVLIQGPRAVGKSTLLRQLADQLGGALVDADDSGTRSALRADPAFFMEGPGPVLIDEYQRVPEVLDAIKAELNRPPTRPGRFVLTGSARHESLPRAAQALTGRLHRMEILPLAQCELTGGPGLLARLFDQGQGALPRGPSDTSREEYVGRIVAGGFPLALGRAPASRSRWFDDYVRLSLERDVAELKKVRKAGELPGALKMLAAQTAQLLNRANIANALGLDDGTVAGYVRLLEAVFLIRTLPAWGKTLTKRAAANAKVHLVDSGVAARLLRLTPEKLSRRDPTAFTQLGHLAETFAVGEILKEASWMDGMATVGHWRTFDHEEVDLVVERDDGLVVAFEVKAGRRVPGEAFSGLAKLRDSLGPAFAAGAVLYLGERAYRHDDRLFVIPMDQLWKEPG
jgi:predicted AAA+ superfamily ATPase